MRVVIAEDLVLLREGLASLLADGGPLVLVLDDLHWSDGASIELIASLGRRRPAAPVLLALGFRPGQASERLAATVIDPGVQRLELGRLSPAEAAKLLGRDDERSVEALYRLGGGNPFFLEQLGRATNGGGLSRKAILTEIDHPDAGEVRAKLTSREIPQAG